MVGKMEKQNSREEKAKTFRILSIDKIIRSGSYPNATKLAKEFEVSRATIMRDLDFLRDRYQAPIEYDYFKKGFYYTDDSFVIQNVLLNESEVFSIFAIQPLLEQYQNTPLEKSVKSIFSKLVDFMPQEVSVDSFFLSNKISFIPEPKPEIRSGVFETVFKCIKKKLTLEFEYKGNKDKKGSVRYADPLHIVCKNGDWYMLAFCHNHKEIRMFSLARIEDCDITKSSFSTPEGFDPEKFFDPAFGVWNSSKPLMNVELKFSPILQNYVLERKFHPSEEKKILEDGSVFVSFKTNQFTQIINWLMTFGKSVEVINPPELIDGIKKQAKEITELYKKH